MRNSSKFLLLHTEAGLLLDVITECLSVVFLKLLGCDLWGDD